MEYGVYGDLIIIYPKQYSIYLRGTIGFGVQGLLEQFLDVSLMAPPGVP